MTFENKTAMEIHNCIKFCLKVLQLILGVLTFIFKHIRPLLYEQTHMTDACITGV